MLCTIHGYSNRHFLRCNVGISLVEVHNSVLLHLEIKILFAHTKSSLTMITRSFHIDEYTMKIEAADAMM